MSGLADFLQLINEKGRRVFVAEKMIDLRNLDQENTIYILQLPDGSTAAGGRAGGLGERRIVRLYRYQFGNSSCERLPEVEDEGRLDSLDLPYHATALPIILQDGAEKLVSGVVDGDLVASYRQIIG